MKQATCQYDARALHICNKSLSKRLPKYLKMSNTFFLISVFSKGEKIHIRRKMLKSIPKRLIINNIELNSVLIGRS